MSSSTSYTTSLTDFSTSIKEKDPSFFLPPIVRNLGEEVIINSVHLRCEPQMDGRFKYTYTLNLSQGDGDDSLLSSLGPRSGRSGHSSRRSRSSSRNCGRSSRVSNFGPEVSSISRSESFNPASSSERKKPDLMSPRSMEKYLRSYSSPSKRSIHSAPSQTARSCTASEYSERSARVQDQLREAIYIDCFIFGKTPSGDFFRRKLSGVFNWKRSLRSIVRHFARENECRTKVFKDHLFFIAGSSSLLKNHEMWQKIPEDKLAEPMQKLCNRDTEDEIVLIVDLINVYGLVDSRRV